MSACWLLVALSLAAAPDAAPAAKKKVKLGAPGLVSANVSPEVAVVANDHFAQQLSLHDFRVVTGGEIAALLGLERQKQLLGCADDTNCMVELSNALGVDGLVTGSLGSFGGRFTVNIKVLAARDGAQLAIFSGTAESERGLPDLLSRAAQVVGQQVRESLGLEQKAEAPVRSTIVLTNRQRWALVPGIVGVLSFIGSGISFGSSSITHASLSQAINQRLTPPEAFSLRSLGEAQRTWGWIGVGVGAGLFALAGWLFWSDLDPPVQPTATVTPHGGTVGLQGALPW